MADTIYFNGFSAKKSKYGIKLSGKVENIIDELNKHVNSKGYINLEITERKEVGKYGETHSVKVDTWEPKPKYETDNTETAPANQDRPVDEIKGDLNDHNDLPF